MKETLMRQIIAKQDEYNKLLSDELDEVVTIAYIHGWHSNRFEQGKQMRDELADLNEQLKQSEVESEVAEIKSTPIPSGWICPRCQKVHSWLDMTCDCEPKTIISTTIIAADRNCNNCKNWYKSGDKSPCNNCINYNNWA